MRLPERLFHELVVENVPIPALAKPQTGNLLELLEDVFIRPD